MKFQSARHIGYHKSLWNHLDRKLKKPSSKFIVYWTLACTCNWICVLTFWTNASPSSTVQHCSRVFRALWYCTISSELSVLLWRTRGGHWSAKMTRTYVSSWREEESLDAASPRRSSCSQTLSYAELPQQCTVVLFRLASSTSPYFDVSTVVGLPPTSLQSVANPITVLTTNGPIILMLESSVRMLNRYANF